MAKKKPKKRRRIASSEDELGAAPASLQSSATPPVAAAPAQPLPPAPGTSYQPPVETQCDAAEQTAGTTPSPSPPRKFLRLKPFGYPAAKQAARQAALQKAEVRRSINTKRPASQCPGYRGISEELESAAASKSQEAQLVQERVEKAEKAEAGLASKNQELEQATERLEKAEKALAEKTKELSQALESADNAEKQFVTNNKEMLKAIERTEKAKKDAKGQGLELLRQTEKADKAEKEIAAKQDELNKAEKKAEEKRKELETVRQRTEQSAQDIAAIDEELKLAHEKDKKAEATIGAKTEELGAVQDTAPAPASPPGSEIAASAIQVAPTQDTLVGTLPGRPSTSSRRPPAVAADDIGGADVEMDQEIAGAAAWTTASRAAQVSRKLDMLLASGIRRAERRLQDLEATQESSAPGAVPPQARAGCPWPAKRSLTRLIQLGLRIQGRSGGCTTPEAEDNDAQSVPPEVEDEDDQANAMERGQRGQRAQRGVACSRDEANGSDVGPLVGASVPLDAEGNPGAAGNVDAKGFIRGVLGILQEYHLSQEQELHLRGLLLLGALPEVDDSQWSTILAQRISDYEASTLGLQQKREAFVKIMKALL